MATRVSLDDFKFFWYNFFIIIKKIGKLTMLENSNAITITSNIRYFDDFYNGLSELNIINRVKDTKRLNKDDLAKPKSLEIFMSHRGEFVSVGYYGKKIVLMAATMFDDLLASRRIFEAVSNDVFFRYVDNIADGLSQSKVTMTDLSCMAHILLTGFEHGDFQISGVLNFDLTNEQLNGRTFSNIIYHLIDEIGYAHKINTDVIINRLHGTLARLNRVSADITLSELEQRNRASSAASDWLSREDLFLSKRPKVRQLYSEIKNHKLIKKF
jgi:hypothetical protein